MKYLINKKTKEHIVYKPCHDHMNSVVWRIVQADSDGWVPHKGDVCPLPEDVPCQVRIKNGSGHSRVREACGWDWAHDNYNAITAYRPIFEPVQEPEKTTQLTTSTIDLIGTLKRAHEHAQQIPDLEAELREVLGSMGYDLVARNPFVEPEAQGEQHSIAEPELQYVMRCLRCGVAQGMLHKTDCPERRGWPKAEAKGGE